MIACSRQLHLSVRAIHRHSHRNLRRFHSLSCIAAAKPLCEHRRIQFCDRMASGVSRAFDTPAETMELPNGDRFEIVAASGLSESEIRNAIDSALFRQWLRNIQSERGLLAGGQLHLRRVEIQGIDMFGNHIGFLKFKAEVFDKQTGMKVPGIVFARGPSVAVLILLESEGETYVVLTEQVRVPVGRLILELPAGMVDDEEGDVVGAAVREIEEETGINLNVQNMVNLTAFLDPSTGSKVFSSPGGCDEELSLFLYKGNANKEIIKALRGKQTGLRDHGELIEVHVVPYNDLWRATGDAKALVAVALYEMAKRNGLLPQ